MDIFRKTLPISRYIFKLNRNIMTTSVKAEKVMEEMKSNPYFEKYAKKIADLQQTSPEEFMSRMEEVEKKKTKPNTTVKERQFTTLLEPKKKLCSDDNVQDEPLDKIMKVELIKDKEPEEIKEIWEKYHMQKETISATIPASDYDIMCSQLKNYPIFLIPLPRSQGYEFIMSQCHGNTIHCTPLICYQVHKENAPECLTITHYTELKGTKGIVLMRGEFDNKTIDAKEAQCIANQLQLYYNKKDNNKTLLLQQFTENPDEFKHASLIKQIEDIKLV